MNKRKLANYLAKRIKESIKLKVLENNSSIKAFSSNIHCYLIDYETLIENPKKCTCGYCEDVVINNKGYKCYFCRGEL